MTWIVNSDGEAQPAEAEMYDALMQHGIDPSRADDILDGVELLVDAGYPPDNAAAKMIAAAKTDEGSVMPMARKIVRIGQSLRDMNR